MACPPVNSVSALRITQYPGGYHIQNLSVDRVTDLVVQTAGAVAVSQDGVRTIGNIADLPQDLQLDLDSLAVMLVVRLFDQMYRHAGLKKLLPVIMIGSCDGKVCPFHVFILLFILGCMVFAKVIATGMSPTIYIVIFLLSKSPL